MFEREVPNRNFEDIFPRPRPPRQRDPLHRTRKVIHTMHNRRRRDLQRVRERAEFDEDGYLSHSIYEEVLCLDCDCNFAAGMAGQCTFCFPPARLCSEHLFHCEKCGKGVCRLHVFTIVDRTTGKPLHYCPRHSRLVRVKLLAGGAFLALLGPLVSQHPEDRR